MITNTQVAELTSKLRSCFNSVTPGYRQSNRFAEYLTDNLPTIISGNDGDMIQIKMMKNLRYYKALYAALYRMSEDRDKGWIIGPSSKAGHINIIEVGEQEI